MTTFLYTAYDKSGAKIDGQIEANDQTLALAELRKQQLLPSEINELKATTNNVFSLNKKSLLS